MAARFQSGSRLLVSSLTSEPSANNLWAKRRPWIDASSAFSCALVNGTNSGSYCNGCSSAGPVVSTVRLNCTSLTNSRDLRLSPAS
ncbi:hypothetical protein D3C76_1158410 [compost metagenome]